MQLKRLAHFWGSLGLGYTLALAVPLYDCLPQAFTDTASTSAMVGWPGTPITVVRIRLTITLLIPDMLHLRSGWRLRFLRQPSPGPLDLLLAKEKTTCRLDHKIMQLGHSITPVSVSLTGKWLGLGANGDKVKPLAARRFHFIRTWTTDSAKPERTVSTAADSAADPADSARTRRTWRRTRRRTRRTRQQTRRTNSGSGPGGLGGGPGGLGSGPSGPRRTTAATRRTQADQRTRRRTWRRTRRTWRRTRRTRGDSGSGPGNGPGGPGSLKLTQLCTNLQCRFMLSGRCKRLQHAEQ